jgi:23S rRNA (uracil1939-C5)-methyltransferase
VTAVPLACPLQSRCPGCPLGDRDYAAGLAQKALGLSAALRPYAELEPELLAAHAASTTHAYRLRAKLVSHGKALGLFARGSHRVIDVRGCRVLSPELTAASEALRRLLPLPLYGADLRETSQGVLITLVAEHERARAELTTQARGLVERGEALGVAVAVRRPGEVRLLSGEPAVAAGPSEARHALSPTAPYGYAAHGGFVQAHAGQASYVYREIADGLRTRLLGTPRPRVLELFAGNGSLALTLAQAGARVTAVEAYAPAILLAERAAREQGLELAACAADAARFAEQIRPHDFDAIVVNPPRRGLDVALRRALLRAAPRALAYVSCNPHTLARDAWHLQTLGLALRCAQPLDMIPWSDAIEVLSWFSPQTPRAPRVLCEDEHCVAIDKLPHDTPSDSLARVRRLPGCDGATALDQWGAGVSGACWFAKPSARGAAEPLERELTVLCRGNLRKQGTITRRAAAAAPSPYKKLSEAGRHSLATVRSLARDEQGVLLDFASIRHPILGDSTQGDASSNEFVQHRHGLDRAFVHVGSSRLRLPSGAILQAQAELSPDLARVVESLSSRSLDSD